MKNDIFHNCVHNFIILGGEQKQSLSFMPKTYYHYAHKTTTTIHKRWEENKMRLIVPKMHIKTPHTPQSSKKFDFLVNLISSIISISLSPLSCCHALFPSFPSFYLISDRSLRPSPKSGPLSTSEACFDFSAGKSESAMSFLSIL